MNYKEELNIKLKILNMLQERRLGKTKATAMAEDIVFMKYAKNFRKYSRQNFEVKR